MAFPEIRLVQFPLDALGTTVEKRAGDAFDARQMSEKGFDFQRGAAAAYVANLEGSVTGDTWTVITALAASVQGTIAAHYNFLRINCGTAGAYDGDTLKAAGKVL